MATIKTKYNINDKLFWVEKQDGIYQIKQDIIKSIKIGGKIYERYEISYTSRREKELFTDFEEARKFAIKKQKEFNKTRYKKKFLANSLKEYIEQGGKL